MTSFKAGSVTYSLEEKTLVMGILNVTPDSFSDGGKYINPDVALKHAKEMIEEGADIIDIGAQSTRPGYTPISFEEEWERLAPVLEKLLPTLEGTKISVSVDTFYPEVAEKALALGVHIINDVSGFTPKMWEVVAKSDCGCIVMHPRREWDYEDPVQEVHEFFLNKQKEAHQYGIPNERLCFDPGIGFKKTFEENLSLITNIEQTKISTCAYLMATSRKRVVGEVCGNPPFEKRLGGTIAADTLAINHGANMIRVHDVYDSVQAARMTEALMKVRRK